MLTPHSSFSASLSHELLFSSTTTHVYLATIAPVVPNMLLNILVLEEPIRLHTATQRVVTARLVLSVLIALKAH